MELSVVIVSWNVEDLLRDCLASLRERLRHAEFETIVVDNASSDDVARMVEREFPEAKLVTNEHNVGFAAAVNQGITLCSGRSILLLNPDTRLVEDSVARMRSVLDERPDVGIVGPRLVDEAGLAASGAGGSFPGPRTVLNTALAMHRLFPRSSWSRGIWLAQDDLTPGVIDWVSGACMLIRREVFDQVGGLDEGFFLLCEDIDFCHRALQAGWRTYYLPGTSVVHHEGSSIGQQDDAFLLSHGSSLSRYMVARYGRATSLLPILALKLNRMARLAVVGAAYLVRRTPSNRQRLLLVRKHLRILS